MNILFVSYYYWPPHFGGELRLSIERFQSLIQRGHSITVLTSGISKIPQEEFVEGIYINRSPVIGNSRFFRGLRRLFFPLWVLIKILGKEFDIIHYGSIGGIGPINNCFGMLILNWAAKIKGARTVYVHSLADTEEEMFSIKSWGHKFRNLWLTQIDAIVSVGPALHSSVLKYHNERSYLIMNAVRDDIFKISQRTDREVFRRNHGVTDESIIFTFLGSVSFRKGFDLIAQAFNSLSNKFPNWLLWVIGPVSEVDSQNINQKEVNKLIGLLSDISDRVRFWGKIDNRQELRNILASSDIFLFPTRKEGLPLAPLEAMACGVPPILSKIPGVTDLANIDNETGLYCKVNDLISLTSAMKTLAMNKNMRKIMGVAARKRVVEAFGWENHIDNWEKLYQMLSRS